MKFLPDGVNLGLHHFSAGTASMTMLSIDLFIIVAICKQFVKGSVCFRGEGEPPKGSLDRAQAFTWAWRHAEQEFSNLCWVDFAQAFDRMRNWFENNERMLIPREQNLRSR